MAETRGFEPPIGFNAYNGLANRRLQPLGHVSAKNIHRPGLMAFFTLRLREGRPRGHALTQRHILSFNAPRETLQAALCVYSSSRI
jgi:hypothetical protein